MLKKKERLTKKEFDRSFSSGKRYHSDLFTLIHDGSGTFHGAVAVGKKVSKKAVDRNKLRRRIYSILYRLSKDNDLRGVYLVLVKPASAKSDFSVMRSTLTKLISSIK